VVEEEQTNRTGEESMQKKNEKDQGVGTGQID